MSWNIETGPHVIKLLSNSIAVNERATPHNSATCWSACRRSQHHWWSPVTSTSTSTTRPTFMSVSCPTSCPVIVYISTSTHRPTFTGIHSTCRSLKTTRASRCFRSTRRCCQTTRSSSPTAAVRCAVYDLNRVSSRSNWRGLDVDAFDADLQQYELFQTPPLDHETAFRCYDQTLRHILGQHAPLVTKRVYLRQSVAWYDSECRATKRTTRLMEC